MSSPSTTSICLRAISISGRSTRQWPVEDLPEHAQTVLTEAQPGGWRFSCEARIKISDRTEKSRGMNELDQAYDVSGRVVCDVTQEMTGERITMPVEQSTTPVEP